MRRYVEAMGGKLELVAQFPDRLPLVIDHLAGEGGVHRKSHKAREAELSKAAA